MLNRAQTSQRQGKRVERSMRILGKLLEETELQNGARGMGINQHNKEVEYQASTPPKPRLSDLGITKNEKQHLPNKVAIFLKLFFKKMLQFIFTKTKSCYIEKRAVFLQKQKKQSV